MKKFILKYLLLSFSVFLIVPACIKDMEIDVPETSREVVVSCLFNPDDKWELTLSETKSIQENEDIYIEDANVEITSETGEVIALDYTGKKEYIKVMTILKWEKAIPSKLIFGVITKLQQKVGFPNLLKPMFLILK